MKKAEYRKIICNTRQQLDVDVQERAAQKVAARLHELTVFNQSKHVACYFSTKGELPTKPIIETIWQSDKICYLPVLGSKLLRNLHFVRYRNGDTLVNNHYSIPEPLMENNEVISSQDLDLIFMPLVAFDVSGNRLGLGGGYYDRTLSFTLRAGVKSPVLIGLAYEWQKVPVIDSYSWDVPLHMVITDSNVYDFNAN